MPDGSYASLDDRCVRCGVTLGQHNGNNKCPPVHRDYPDYWNNVWNGDYWDIRGTVFLNVPQQLVLPDGV